MTSPTAAAAAGTVPPPPRASLQRLLFWGVMLALLAGSWKGADIKPMELVRSGGNIGEFLSGFFPPRVTD